jgi:transposase InsO family protein
MIVIPQHLRNTLKYKSGSRQTVVTRITNREHAAMSYVTSPYAPRARREAVNLVVKDGWKPAAVARYVGVHRSTVGRWLVKARGVHGTKYLYNESARPHSSPSTLDQRTVNQICILRRTLGRCAPVIHAHLLELGIQVSLSSVHRTFKRQGLVKPRSKWARFRPSVPRPRIERPGDLVQTDTVHYVLPDGKRRVYLYTVIDLYSRWAYVEYHPKIAPGIAAEVILRAQEEAGFAFRMVQSDNGPEYSNWFTDRLRVAGIPSRHSRVRRPNDNAHIERFNRTIQEECFGGLRPQAATAAWHLNNYLRYYNEARLHLGIGLSTPARIVAKVVK